MLDIYIPILRIERIDSILKNISDTTSDYNVCFIVEKADFDTLKSLKKPHCTILLNKRTPTYSGAINSAYEQTNAEYFFTGADDLSFHKDWHKYALAKMSDTIGVVGTNDLMNVHVLKGEKATHYLVKREYIKRLGGTIDNSYPVLFEYKHNYCDWEFIETAKKRGVFAPCLDSIVKHNHWTKGRAKFDAVYEKSNISKQEDKETFDAREILWK